MISVISRMSRVALVCVVGLLAVLAADLPEIADCEPEDYQVGSPSSCVDPGSLDLYLR